MEIFKAFFRGLGIGLLVFIGLAVAVFAIDFVGCVVTGWSPSPESPWRRCFEPSACASGWMWEQTGEMLPAIPGGRADRRAPHPEYVFNYGYLIGILVLLGMGGAIIGSMFGVVTYFKNAEEKAKINQLKQRATKGDAQAMYELGALGEGNSWYEKAVDLGHEGAKRALQRIEEAARKRRIEEEVAREIAAIPTLCSNCDNPTWNCTYEGSPRGKPLGDRTASVCPRFRPKF
ncbi:MAG: hypothetical protein FWF81_12825 [Defluviitaleaceae bacterium]|nr:hypothetical protein [Defluviitaleaceae bacterium]